MDVRVDKSGGDYMTSGIDGPLAYDVVFSDDSKSKLQFVYGDVPTFGASPVGMADVPCESERIPHADAMHMHKTAPKKFFIAETPFCAASFPNLAHYCLSH